MRGRVLSWQDLEGTGLIGGDDGQRYSFVRGDLQNGVRTVPQGAEVDFETSEAGQAQRVFALGQGAPTQGGGAYSGDKNRVTAALLAVFLGWLGAHKFYLGKTNAAVIMLLCGTLGWLLFAIPPVIVGVIAFIEFILYLTKTDQQFYQEYVVGTKSWF